ncbi:MAG: tetratricopeptide repeat protein [Stenomitos frigidus ULC029]
MTDPIANKIGVANLGTVYGQTNYVTIHEAQRVKLIYSDPLPDLRVFQGRGTERSDLNTWLADRSVSMISIRGEGGIGKSTLMAKVFAESQGFAGKFWADVRTGTSITTLIERAFQELGVPPEQTQNLKKEDLLPRLLRYLQQGRYLLAIDNLESVLTATGDWQSGYEEFFDSFESLGSESVLLLGSREYPPKYFGWRQSCRLTLEYGLEPAEGAALLAALEVEDTDKQREAISVQVQGNPLALALIAGWLREQYRPGERTITHLQQHPDLFQLTGRRGGESQVSMERVLQWSIDRLTPENQRLLLNVSFLPEDFDLTMASRMVSDISISDTNLDDLERRSLLQALPKLNEGQSKRFRLQPRIQDLLQKRKINLMQQSLKTACENGDRGGEAKWLSGLGWAYHHLREYQQAIEYYQQSLEIKREIGDRGDEANLLNSLAGAYHSSGEYQRTIECYQQSLEITREIGDRRGEINLLIFLGDAYHSSGEYQRTIEYQQALEIAREIGDRRAEAESLGSLGRAYNDMFGAQKAVEYLQQSLKITREMGDRRAEGMLLLDLTTTYRWLKEYQRLIDCRQQILEIIREMGDRRAEGVALAELAHEYHSLGEYQQAIDCYQQSSEIAHEIGNRHNEEVSLYRKGSALIDMGYALLQIGQRSDALQRFQQALGLFEDLKLEHMIEKCKTAIQNQRRKWWQRWWLWFAVGVAIVLLIWWLKQ